MLTPPSVERRFGATSPAPDTVHGRALTSIESASLLRFSTVRLFVAPAVAARSTSSGATTRPPWSCAIREFCAVPDWASTAPPPPTSRPAARTPVTFNRTQTLTPLA